MAGTIDIAVLGAGESGTGAAVLAKKKGLNVFVSDRGQIHPTYKNVLSDNGISWEEGIHSEDKILSASEIIKSPGIPDCVPIVVKAREQGLKVISEIEFASRYTKAKKICITGSNGKTTTSTLTYHILKTAGYNVGLAGNVGVSFAMQVAQHDFDHYVLEISSFQLDGMYDFKADVAVLLNITPDHLDRYDNSFARYVESKFRIMQNQTCADYFIYMKDDATIIQYLDGIRPEAQMIPITLENDPSCGAYMPNDSSFIININKDQFIMETKDLSISGKHNIYNSMASGISARLIDIRKEFIKQSFSEFENIEHRLEHVAMVRGVEFINDSKATNVNSSWYALESIKKPVVWIVGGIDKGNDYGQLMELVKSKVKAIVCLGKDNSRIVRAFEFVVPNIVETSSAADAVKAAYYLGEPGDVVLLSPACASFDLFENFEDRGRQFKREVMDL